MERYILAIVGLILMQSCAISPIRLVNSFFLDEDSCDIYISDWELLEKLYKKEYSKYEIKPNDVVAEIGAANLFLSLSIMCFVDDVTFYVQDIKMRCLTEEIMQKGKEHFTKLRGEGPLKGTIHLVKGEQNLSNLPYNTFDKAILRLVYHEFEEPEKNLRDIYQILKPEGVLFIGEDIEKKKDKKVKCGLHRTHEHLLQEVEKEGFKFERIVYEKRKFKVYKFVKV
jgi:SAM-dependent methyltransferase